ncbi:hypothetical protein [Flammeovirga pacifica]|uniref:DUF4625 domain-containing protein n=1 Tax=Flammeovirga pacifica TaxID=915059 RepID=A0A1S1Z555_FLAPC|nr:hypothetical protein [Flammeovirga pacifica]OHX68283.1 hypothetical protein NH26_18990 [Flammeovirga pacifica]
MNTLKNISLLFIAALFFASCSKNNNEEADIQPQFANIEITNVEDGQTFVIDQENTVNTKLYTPNGYYNNAVLVFTHEETGEVISFDLIGKVPTNEGQKELNFTTKFTPKTEGFYQIHAQFEYVGESQGIIKSEDLTISTGAFLPTN